ncbi:phage portal protein [Alkalihalophilus marmarensis]|uniref:phage portal protein n=1 Tax=Alkalihalophilus marmarensis TaxID=521377 RepID=UPI002E1A4BA5|nr:phage portal protein [Alkalihalophilus marmarensis]MED1603643.1 phage portal protein [Alkalihalophilus marmarensis]
MNLLDIFKRNSELDYMFDLELFQDVSDKIYYKKLAIQTCINIIARTISQSEFRVKNNKKSVKDDLYYKLNVRPNRNMSASMFWNRVIHKLVYENHCLIIKNDTDDLLIADNFERIETANYNDRFRNVTIKDYTFQRTFSGDDVIFIEYANDNLIKLIDSVYSDYGELLGRMIETQKLKGQLRATVDVEQISGKDEEKTRKLQNFIDRIYESIQKKVVAIIPQQKGFTYKEHASNNGEPSVKEINELTNGFLVQVARALGIPPSFVLGEVADNEKQARNYMMFCIDPLIKKIKDELNAKFFTVNEYLNGQKVEIRRISYQNVFDLATSADKLRSSGVMNGHEIRDKLGLDESDDPSLDKFLITKNYEDSSESIKGGEKDEA